MLQLIAKSKDNATTKNGGVCSFTHIPGCFLEELVLLPWLRQLTPSNQKYFLDKAGSSGFSQGRPPCREGRTLPEAKAGHCSLGYQQRCSGNSSITPPKNAQEATWAALLYWVVSSQWTVSRARLSLRDYTMFQVAANQKTWGTHPTSYHIICLYAIQERRLPDTCSKVKKIWAKLSIVISKTRMNLFQKAWKLGNRTLHFEMPNIFCFRLKKISQYSQKTKLVTFLSVYERKQHIWKDPKKFFSIFVLYFNFQQIFFLWSVKRKKLLISQPDVWKPHVQNTLGKKNSIS